MDLQPTVRRLPFFAHSVHVNPLFELLESVVGRKNLLSNSTSLFPYHQQLAIFASAGFQSAISRLGSPIHCVYDSSFTAQSRPSRSRHTHTLHHFGAHFPHFLRDDYCSTAATKCSRLDLLSVRRRRNDNQCTGTPQKDLLLL